MTAIALITGASGGIGRALARQLHVQGCRVAAVGRVNLDSAVYMLQAWIGALQGGPGAAVFASSVVARIGVANVMAWLLGDGAARLTGQVLAVDGGFTTVRSLVK